MEEKLLNCVRIHFMKIRRIGELWLAWTVHFRLTLPWCVEMRKADCKPGLAVAYRPRAGGPLRTGIVKYCTTDTASVHYTDGLAGPYGDTCLYSLLEPIGVGNGAQSEQSVRPDM